MRSFTNSEQRTRAMGVNKLMQLHSILTLLCLPTFPRVGTPASQVSVNAHMAGVVLLTVYEIIT